MVRASVAQVLLFIAAVSGATLLAGGVVTESGVYAQSVADESEREVATLDAEIAIINDADAGATYDDSDERLTLYVKNVGGSSLEPNESEVLVDGEYVRPSERTVLGTDTAAAPWRVDTVLELTIDLAEPLEAGEHRVAVEVHSARELLTFTVE